MTATSPTPGSPAEVDELFALALQETRAGRLAEAAAAYRKILGLQPNNAAAHNNLGNVLKDQGRLNEAAVHYEHAVTLKPDLFGAHINLGHVLRAQGKLDQAAARYRRVLLLRPDLAEVYTNLGGTLWQQGKLREAADQYQGALALKPELVVACVSLGKILSQMGKLEQARARFEQAIALKPDRAEIHNLLGYVLHEQGNRDLARLSYSQALNINPNYSDAHNNLGRLLGEEGKFDEAMACYERALALTPDHAEALFNRATLKKFCTGDPDLVALETLATRADPPPPSQMLYIHFALGKALEDTGDYPRAFQHFRQGNALKRRETNYDAAADQKTCRSVAEIFDARFFDQFPAVGDPSSTPIFVLGMPRSGSTLVEQILASHPQVHAAGELGNLHRIVKAVSKAEGRPIFFPRSMSGIDADGLRRLAQAYLASLPALPAGKTRIADKMPSNFLYVGLIHLMLPNARIIHTVRDPLDTCVSCFCNLFHTGQAFSYDLGELGRHYRWYHELMAHWRSVLPTGAMLDVVYEDVVDNLEAQARRLLDYCGLPWDDRCLDFHKTDRPIVTASTVQARQPLYRNSLQRWRRYERYLQPLLVELKSCRRTR